MVVMKNMMGEK
ncbi:unnamed protein product [Lactuca saligna]|uniref:Uncharacterized protein n=1 Tax=Lactuca saligna TaxID=75948 RepID=A0AA36ENA5_LACSI|nr:unnamed protein product [Lactuca saligna]